MSQKNSCGSRSSGYSRRIPWKTPGASTCLLTVAFATMEKLSTQCMAVRDEGTVENQGPPKETKVENKVGSEDFVQQLKIFSLNSDSVGTEHGWAG